MKKLLKSLLAVMLIAMMALSFTSCGVARTPEKAEKKLEKAGYTVETTDDEATRTMVAEMYGLKAEDIEVLLTASKGDEYVSIIYCTNAKAAKKIAKELKKEMKEAKEAAEKLSGTLKEEAEKELKNTKYGRSGKAVYTGTKAGVKAA